MLSLHRTRKFHVVGPTSETHCPEPAAHPPAPTPARPVVPAAVPRPRPLPGTGVYVAVDCPDTSSHVLRALRSRGVAVTGLRPRAAVDPPCPAPMPAGTTLFWGEYEHTPWDGVPLALGASSFRVRKGLSRKAQLASYCARYAAKRRGCALASALPLTLAFETWAAFEETDAVDRETGAQYSSMTLPDRLHMCMGPVKQLMRQYTEDADGNPLDEDPPTWILKASTSNRGAGIVLCKVYEEAYEYAAEHGDEAREWVLQKYIGDVLTPMGWKFHLRVYVLAVGRPVRVYCYRGDGGDGVLALFAAKKYRDPRRGVTGDDAARHITNSCYAAADGHRPVVRTLSDLPRLLARDGTLPAAEGRARCAALLATVQEVVHDLFAAYAGATGAYDPLPGCFEQYGLDFLVTDRWAPVLLEANPGPDFGQTGDALGEAVVGGFMEATVDVALCGGEGGEAMPMVYEHTH